MFNDIGGPIYAVIVLVVVFLLYRAHKDKDTDFSLFDLLKENDRVSKISVAFLVTLFTSSWYVVHESLSKTGLSDVAFAAYLAAWVAPILTHLLKGNGTPEATKQ